MSGIDLEALIMLWNLLSGTILCPAIAALVFTFGFILHDAVGETSRCAEHRETLTDGC